MIGMREKVAERFPHLGLIKAPENHIRTVIRNWFQTDVYCISYRGDRYRSWFLVYLPEENMVSIVKVWGVGYPANITQESTFRLGNNAEYEDILRCLNLANEIFVALISKVIE